MASQPQELTQTQLEFLNSALSSGELKQVRRMMNGGLKGADVAHLIESSPPKVRSLLWNLVDPENEGEVLQYLSYELQESFLREMDPEEVVAAVENLDIDDLADMMQHLPSTVISEVLRSMDQQDRERLEKVLSYPEDTAGGLMNTDTITVRPDISIEAVLRYLRRHSEIPAMTDSLFVVSRKDDFIGVLPLTKVLMSDPDISVREVMITDSVSIRADTEDTEVAKLFERHDLVSAPVIDDEGILLGRITIDDVVDVIRETSDHSLMSMAGLDEDADTFAPVMKTAKRRAVWLGINLITAFIASSVIGMFEATIQKVVALAVLMPIVASMGGIAGSQALTLVIRGQALGQLEKSNLKWLLNRELLVGVMNGLLWAVVIGLAAVFWFDDKVIGIVIACAIVINLIAAALSGTLLPPLLKAWGIDPALAGSVILTTITDVIGFMSFLGLATLFYF
ncbi:magnesium transporter [Pokkaliibacter sp. CJK22405]|uniref:magnesium transporter n=1 Tax=Pokkaliibacter sp. CJK22405 TaxID=3384615 RepID=UPI00398497E7